MEEMMKKEYTAKQMTKTRWFYTFTEPNAKGEKVVIELCKCADIPGKDSMPKLWVKHGFINRVLETYWNVQTYVTDKDGNGFMYYNPQVKPNKKWAKNGKSRIYVSRRNKQSAGYIDLNKNCETVCKYNIEDEAMQLFLTIYKVA